MIVERFSDAALAAVHQGRILQTDLAGLQARWSDRVRARADAAVWRLMPLLVAQPAITVKVVQEALGVSAPTAQNAIDQLVGADVVSAASGNRRNRVWLAHDVVAALDAFAARAGNRRRQG